ncbi:DNA helicase [Tanacetum coccineum]|uniref:ATP-dependent DNA helicase n=1 Tax=Tanacetum coccineum TaxID=301880 RepID=A0ABQ5AW41_9ASTR
MLEDLKNKLLMEERNYKRDLLSQDVAQFVPKLNRAQKEIFSLIINASEESRQELLFVYGHGGTGKTFLCTTHSRFKLPLNLTDESVCHAKKHSQLANLLIATDLIIWDEAPMNDRRCFKALDITLRDLMSAPEILFGGKTVILGGDFQQTLPVKKGAAKEELIHAFIMESYLWPHFKVCTLKENIRLLRSDLSDEERKRSEVFAKWLLDVGGVPDEYYITPGKKGLSELINFIYDDATLKAPTAGTLQEKAIVCPKNDTADEVNAKILSSVKGVMKTYLSRDEAIPMGKETSEIELLYLMEYLNTITFPGFSPHELQLKMGTPSMMLRNVINKDVTNYYCSSKSWTRKLRARSKGVMKMGLQNHSRNESDSILLHPNRQREQCSPDTKPYQQTLENPVSLRFRKITTFEILTEKEYEFPKHHFEFTAYNQLQSKVPYRDENNKMIYPILTDYLGCIHSIGDIIPSGDANTVQKYRRHIDIENLDGNVIQLTMWDDLAKYFNKQEIEKLPFPTLNAVSSCQAASTDVQLAATLATYYYINPQIPEAENAYTMFKEKYNMNPPLQVSRHRFHYPEHEKTRNRQTLQTLLEQDPTSFKFVESAKNGAGRFIVNDILDIQTPIDKQSAGDKLATTSASPLNQLANKDKAADTQLATTLAPTVKESTSKDKDIPGTRYH